MSKYKFSKRSLRHLKNVEPLMIAIFTHALTHNDCPFDFGIPKTGGKRSAQTQNELFHKGWSKLDGYTKKSYHQTGRAIDIYAYINGKLTYNKGVMTKLANHIMKIAQDKYNTKLVWGGNWTTFVDLPHFQVSKNQL